MGILATKETLITGATKDPAHIERATLMQLCNRFQVGIIQVIPKKLNQPLRVAFYKCETPRCFDITEHTTGKHLVNIHFQGDTPDIDHLYFWEMVIRANHELPIRQQVIQALQETLFKDGLFVEEALPL